jgi:hypothetical protein
MTGGSLPAEGESAFLGRNVGFERAGAFLGALIYDRQVWSGGTNWGKVSC